MDLAERCADVTVVIPAFNAESTIVATIKSVRAAINCPVIVVDDGSSDTTARLAQHEGVQLLQQANAGPGSARATGLTAVTSEFVVMLDSDDQLLPAFRALVDVMREHETAAVVAGRPCSRRNVGVAHDISPGRASQQARHVSTPALLRLPVSPFPPSCAIWRVAALDLSNDLPTPRLRPRLAEDYEQLIRVSLVGDVLQVDRCVTLYDSRSGRSVQEPVADAREANRVRIHYGHHLGLPVPTVSALALSAQGDFRVLKAARQKGPMHLAVCIVRHPVGSLRAAWWRFVFCKARS